MWPSDEITDCPVHFQSLLNAVIELIDNCELNKQQMSNISSDLQSYLSSSQKGASSSSGVGFISLNLPTFSGYSKLSSKPDNPFDEEAQTEGSSPERASSWMSWIKGEDKPKQESNSCIPEMSRKHRLIG